MSRPKHHARSFSPRIVPLAPPPLPPTSPYPTPTALPVPRRLLTTMTSEQRKEYPVATGAVDYFPDALTLVAHISWMGNQKHNPGQPLHWARGKSADHADCQMRHMIERGTEDPTGADHLAQKAWRALAELQEFLETKFNLDLPRGATAPGVDLPAR